MPIWLTVNYLAYDVHGTFVVVYGRNTCEKLIMSYSILLYNDKYYTSRECARSTSYFNDTWDSTDRTTIYMSYSYCKIHSQQEICTYTGCKIGAYVFIRVFQFRYTTINVIYQCVRCRLLHNHRDLGREKKACILQSKSRVTICVAIISPYGIGIMLPCAESIPWYVIKVL